MKHTIKILALVLVLALTMCALASCAPSSDPDKALAALKDNGYAAGDSDALATVLNGLLLVARVDAKADTIVSGSKIDENDAVQTVTIVYFKDSESAKNAWETVKEYAEENKKDDEDSSWTIKQSGAMIYWGTADGIAAAR